MIDEQKTNQVTFGHHWKTSSQKNQDFLNNIITCNELWFYHYDPKNEIPEEEVKRIVGFKKQGMWKVLGKLYIFFKKQ